MSDFSLRAIITAVDKLSPVLAKQSRAIRAWSKGFKQAGAGAVPMAVGLGAGLAVATREFMQLENASTQLQNTLMTNDGVAAGFEELSKIAIDLGNRLPGTSADFFAMASQLKALGVTTDSLMGGALEAAANLAVVGKPLGVTYDQAAESIGKLSNAFGIADKDLIEFADTIQKSLHLGIELEQFQYGMARISGPLKAAGMQGLQVAKDMTPLLGMLIKAGVSGEEAGTGIKTMITAAISENRFTGVRGLVADLEKLNKLPVAEKMAKLGDLFGEQHAGKAAIVAAGGYAELVKQMEKQASLQQRINNSLGTLTNLWDAATGSFQNVLAAFAESYAPELKDLATELNGIAGKAMGWVNANKPMINTAVKAAAIFVGVKLALMGVGVALAFVSRLMLMNPIGLFLQALAYAAPLIYANWDAITAFIKTNWDKTVAWLASKWGYFVASYAGIKDRINEITQQAADYFKDIWQGAIDWVSNKFSGLFGVVSSISNVASGMMSGIGSAFPSANGMSLPGQARKPIVSNHGFKGSLDINHQNAPAGFRASPVQSKGPVRVNQNVGYNFMVTGH